MKAVLAECEVVGYQIQGGKMNEHLVPTWDYELEISEALEALLSTIDHPPGHRMNWPGQFSSAPDVI